MNFLRLLEDTVTNTASNGTEDDLLSMNNNNATINNMTNNDDGSSTDFDMDYSTVIICLSWMVFMLYCCCQPRAGRSTEQGDRIRRLARERWERERNQNCRTEQNPEKRSEVMNLCMRTKRVISKNKNGDLHLGPVEPSNTTSTAGSNDDTPSSPGLATLPVQKDEGNCNILDDDEDEEQACVICLDSFEVGDIVSWSRHSPTCQHVFHKDCIEPWLLERRQDECPSCRSKLIMYNYDDPDSPVKENLENLLSISFDEDLAEDDDEAGGEGMFTIVQGLISRATRRASYALVGNTDSIEEEMEEGRAAFMAEEEQESSSSSLSVNENDLATPSVFRRVASVGSASLAGRSISSLRHSSSSISNYLVMPRRLFPDKDIGDDDASSDIEVDVESGGRLELEHGPYPLRRVVSDKGLSPRTPNTADSSMASTTETMESTTPQSPTDLPQLNHPFGSQIGLCPMLSSGSLSSGYGIPRQRSFSFLAMRNVSDSYRRQIVPTSDDDLTESSLDDGDHNEEEEKDGDDNNDMERRYSSPTSSVHGINDINDEDTSNLTIPNGTISPISNDSL